MMEILRAIEVYNPFLVHRGARLTLLRTLQCSDALWLRFLKLPEEMMRARKRELNNKTRKPVGCWILAGPQNLIDCASTRYVCD